MELFNDRHTHVHFDILYTVPLSWTDPSSGFESVLKTLFWWWFHLRGWYCGVEYCWGLNRTRHWDFLEGLSLYIFRNKRTVFPDVSWHLTMKTSWRSFLLKFPCTLLLLGGLHLFGFQLLKPLCQLTNLTLHCVFFCCCCCCHNFSLLRIRLGNCLDEVLLKKSFFLLCVHRQTFCYLRCFWQTPGSLKRIMDLKPSSDTAFMKHSLRSASSVSSSALG